VGTETRIWAGRYLVRIHSETRGFPPNKIVQSGSGTPSASYSRCYFPGWGGGVKGPGCDFDRSRPSSDEVKNEWSYRFIPSICLHGANSEKFNFVFWSLFIWRQYNIKEHFGRTPDSYLGEAAFKFHPRELLNSGFSWCSSVPVGTHTDGVL
jgi:hypothetical protein